MGENVKNKLILVLAILTIIFFLISASSCINNRKQKIEKDREIASRMDLEEKLSKFNAEKAKLEDKITAMNKIIEEDKAAAESTQKTLLQEQLVNKSLKEELEKLTKLKEKLEENLKEALVASPKKK